MSKPNYSFAKRQRDLAKQRKKLEKQERKALKSAPASETPPPPVPEPTTKA